MAIFYKADQLTREFYEGEFDRVVKFKGSAEFRVLQEAARSRSAYRIACGIDALSDDEYLAALPADLPNMAMNPSHVARFVGLLQDYAVICYVDSTLPDLADVDANRFEARILADDLKIGSEAFDMTQLVDFDNISWGEAAA